ncbi:MAG: TonB-dependent receptor [Rhodospirillaceae bacterium]|nr:TonB-dependent receptor [Rhodospirillaceae bacterium]
MTILERHVLQPCANLKRALAALLGIAFLCGSSALLAQEEDDQEIEVIVVTAQKREQSVLEVPFSISAVGQDEIEAAGVNSMADIFRRVPSLAVIDQGAARKNVIIRGIQTDTSTESSVNDVYLDEQRITSVIATADPRTFDMERVEVLRGPQGTLFGGGSFSGTMRYITNRANVSEFETNVAATLSSTADAGGMNYSLDGMVNIPLVEDRFAVRLVGYSAEDSGYLSNSLLGFDDVAGIENNGTRIGLRWTPNDRLTIDYKYLFQDLQQNGFPEARGADPEDLQQGGVTLTEERLTSKLRISDLTWNYDLGFATLTSATGYLQFDFLRRNDESLPFIRDYLEDDGLNAEQALSMAPSALRLYVNDDNDNYTFTQEVRLASNIDSDDRFAWLAGTYYEIGDESVGLTEALAPGGGALFGNANWNGSPADFFFMEQFVTELEQLAFFGEVTWFATDRLQATVGYRRSEFESSFIADEFFGDYADDDGNVVMDVYAPDPPPKETHHTYKFNLSYDLNDDTMVYFQSAEGFQLGSSGIAPALSPRCENLIANFLDNRGLGYLLQDGRLPGTKSDELLTREIGAKGVFANGRGTFMAGFFNGAWKDIQVYVEIPPINGECDFGFGANAAAATTVGWEGEFSYAFTDRFTLSAAGSIVDATIDKDEPDLEARKGDRLPGSPDMQLSLSGDYVWPLANGNQAFVRVDAQYIGEIIGSFTLDDERTVSGNYGLANLRVGMESDRYEWSFFADNLTDNRALVFSDGVDDEFRRTIMLQPRTLGLQFRSRF